MILYSGKFPISQDFFTAIEQYGSFTLKSIVRSLPFVSKIFNDVWMEGQLYQQTDRWTEMRADKQQTYCTGPANNPVLVHQLRREVLISPCSVNDLFISRKKNAAILTAWGMRFNTRFKYICYLIICAIWTKIREGRQQTDRLIWCLAELEISLSFIQFSLESPKLNAFQFCLVQFSLAQTKCHLVQFSFTLSFIQIVGIFLHFEGYLHKLSAQKLSLI